VRHDDGGPLLGRQQVVESLLHDPLGLAVERAGRLVEEQDLRVFDDRPRDRDPLTLAARELRALRADLRIIFVRERLDEVVGVGCLGRLDDLLVGRALLAVPNVLHDRRLEEYRLLCNEANLVAQPLHVELPHIHAVDEHAALCWIVESRQQRDDS